MRNKRIRKRRRRFHSHDEYPPVSPGLAKENGLIRLIIRGAHRNAVTAAARKLQRTVFLAWRRVGVCGRIAVGRQGQLPWCVWASPIIVGRPHNCLHHASAELRTAGTVFRYRPVAAGPSRAWHAGMLPCQWYGVVANRYCQYQKKPNSYLKSNLFLLNVSKDSTQVTRPQYQ